MSWLFFSRLDVLIGSSFRCDHFHCRCPVELLMRRHALFPYKILRTLGSASSSVVLPFLIQRGTWNEKKADNDFHKRIVDAYEVKNQELAAENADLRALLRTMQADMRDFLNAPNGKPACPVNDRLDSDPSQSPLGYV